MKLFIFLVLVLLISLIITYVSDVLKRQHKEPIVLNFKTWVFPMSVYPNWYKIVQNGYSIKMSNTGLTLPTNRFSMSFMYKLTATNNAYNNIVHITNTGGDDNRCPGIWINPNEKTFHLSYMPYVVGTEKIENGIELNTEAFISIVFDNNKINLYVNGTNNKFSNNNTPILDKVLSTATMYIGGPYYNIGNGTIQIQDFTLYDGVLTPDQIKTIYNESTPAGREKLALDTKNAADAKATEDAKAKADEKAASDIVYSKQVSDSRASQSLNQLNLASKLANDELILYTNNKDAIGIKNAKNVINQYKTIIDNSFNITGTGTTSYGNANPDRANAGAGGFTDFFGTPSPVSSATSLYPSDVPQVSKKILDSLSTPISKCNGCFSLKLLVSGYTGHIIKIRRADGQTMSFNSSSTGSLTSGISNIATFLSGSIGYVDTWYDQSGKGNHATQTITASQPIFDITNNCIDFGYSNTSNLFMNIPSGTVPVTVLDASYSFVVKHGYSRNINGSFIGAGTRSPNKSNSFRFNGTIHSYWNYWFSNDFGWDDKNTNVPISSSVTYNGTSKTQKGYISNTLQSTILNRTGQNTASGIQMIGNTNSTSTDQFLQGQLYSVIIYSSELPQSDITILNEV